jgi:putative salt-induced outer membrane protein YdiY
MIRRSRFALAVLFVSSLLAITARPAAAQDTEQVKPTKITADAAYISTNGNTEVTTISGGDRLEHKTGNWLFTQEARAVWGEADGEENAGKYNALLRPDYLLSERVSAYALGAWRRDTFSGIVREFEEGVGLSWHALTGKVNQVDLDGGVGLIQRKNTTDTEDSFSTTRAGARYKHSFTEKAYFEARGAYLFNLEDGDDSQGNGSLSLVAPIAGKFAMKLGYDVFYRNKPLDGFEKTDTTFGAGIQFAN